MRKVLFILVALLVLAPAAGARVAHQPQMRQGQCEAPAGGAQPTVTGVTVDGQAVPAGSTQAGPGMGKLYYSIEAGSGQLNGMDCLLPWTIRLNRDYTGAQPSNGQWSSVWGVAWHALDHATLAQKFNSAYTDQPAVSATSKVVITLSLDSAGAYTPANAYWYSTTGKLEGNTGIQVSGNTMTITGSPAPAINAPEQWPTGLAADFNAYTADKAAYDLNTWPGGAPNGYDARTDPPTILGSQIAPAASLSLQYSFNIRFSNGPLGMGSEQQRGSWFEAVNSPRWTFMFSNQGGSPSLQLGMGNYHEYYDTANVPTLSSGSLRMLLPDAWATLAFGVTSASDPTLIQGAIQVTRTEAGSTTPVAAVTTPVAGQGIIVDAGTVTFSSPNFTTKKNTSVKARTSGKNVVLQFKLTAAQLKAGKNKVTIWGGTKKLKKLTTVTAKKGNNSVTVAYIKKGGYAVKAGKAVVGSATVR